MFLAVYITDSINIECSYLFNDDENNDDFRQCSDRSEQYVSVGVHVHVYVYIGVGAGVDGVDVVVDADVVDVDVDVGGWY